MEWNEAKLIRVLVQTTWNNPTRMQNECQLFNYEVVVISLDGKTFCTLSSTLVLTHLYHS